MYFWSGEDPRQKMNHGRKKTSWLETVQELDEDDNLKL